MRTQGLAKWVWISGTGVLAAFAVVVGFWLARGTVTFATTKVITVPSGSMLPTLKVGKSYRARLDVFLKAIPKCGDIVVFFPPSEALYSGEGMSFWVSRCVGVPGDLIEIKEGVLWRNGTKIAEPYLKDPMDNPYDFKLIQYKGQIIPLSISFGLVNNDNHTASKYFIDDPELMKQYLKCPPARIPPGFCIVMGDNRNGAFDSRAWGPVQLDRVVARIDDLTPL